MRRFPRRATGGLALADRASAPASVTRSGGRRSALLVTSTIAGLATAPYAAFHFQRVAPLTLLANFAAMPVVGVVVMPMALPRRRG